MVYFSAAGRGASGQAGGLVRAVSADVPLMIGEFEGADRTGYIMVVNLSLERSARFAVETTGARRIADALPRRTVPGGP